MEYDLDKFITGKQDELRDLVAFSLYERVKTEYEKKLDEDGVSKTKREDKLDGFAAGNLNPEKIDSLKLQAKEMLINFSDELSRKKTIKLFIYNVLAGLVATIIFSICSSFIQYNITTRKVLIQVQEALTNIEQIVDKKEAKESTEEPKETIKEESRKAGDTPD